MLTSLQIDIICEEIKKDPRVRAILITGSYVYGTPNENSDLDIRMVTNGFEEAHKDDLWKFGVRIEAFYNPPESIRKYFERARLQIDPPHIIHFWTNGKIVYDPDGIAKTLQTEAKKIWITGPSQGDWPPRKK